MKKSKVSFFLFATLALLTCMTFLVIVFVKLDGNNMTRIVSSSFHRGFVNMNSKRKRAYKITGKYGSCSSMEESDHATIKIVKETTYQYFDDSFKIRNETAVTWFSEEYVKTFCDNHVRIFDNRFAVLHYVILDSSKRINANRKPKGGEHLREVLGQKEASEFFKFSKGFLSVRCDSVDIPIVPKIPLLRYVNKAYRRMNTALNELIVDDNITLAITREDYVNLHNVIRQFYNAFLLMMILKKQPKDVSVLFLDGHPAGSLDQPWVDIFRQVARVGKLTRPMMYKTLIVGLKETDGGLTDFKSNHLAFSEQFRSFFLCYV